MNDFGHLRGACEHHAGNPGCSHQCRAHGFTRDARRLAERNRLRAVFTNYSLVHLARVLPQLVVISVLSFVGYLATGRLSKAMALADAWWWNLRSLPSLLAKHRSGAAIRKVPDGDIRRLQQHGSTRLAAFLRGKARQRVGAEVAASGRHFIDGARAGANWLVIAGWTALLAFFALASRDLITGRVPVAGGLVPELGTLGEQVASYLSGWRPHGLGQTAPPPSMIGMLSTLSAVFLGRTGAVRLVVTIGPIVLGWVGMWSLTRPFEEGRARLAAVGVYALVPLAGAAMSDGRWSSVALYAAAPWLLSQLLRSTGIAPFGEPFGWPRRLMPTIVARVAVIVAIVASLAPVVLVVLPLLAVVLAASLLVTGGRKAALRVVIAGVLGPVIGVVLLVPFAIGRSGLWVAWSQRNRSSLTTADVLRFDLAGRWWLTGPLVTVAALLAVAAAQGWRLAWAVRFAVCVLGGLVVSVLVARGIAPIRGRRPRRGGEFQPRGARRARRARSDGVTCRCTRPPSHMAATGVRAGRPRPRRGRRARCSDGVRRSLGRPGVRCNLGPSSPSCRRCDGVSSVVVGGT